MNRKLHNTVTALFATSGLLVLSLIAARPLPTQETLVAPAAVHAELRDSDVAAAEAAKARGRHAAEAAKRIEARAAQLEARLAATKDHGEALGEIVGFAAEAATLAAVATAFDEAQAAEPAAPVVKVPKRTGGRQSVAMPFFSFAPRG
jgi:hypothetical protein